MKRDGVNMHKSLRDCCRPELFSPQATLSQAEGLKASASAYDRLSQNGVPHPEFL